MRYGAMNFPIRPILDEIESVARLGFDYLEMAMDAPEAHHTVIRDNLTAINQALRRHNLGLVCHLPTFVHTADLTKSIRNASIDEMLHTLAVAAELEPMKVVVHPSYIGGLGVLAADMAMSLAQDAMAMIIDRASQLGLRMCLENMFATNFSYFVEPEEFIPLFAAYESLNLTLDTGHANIKLAQRDRNLVFVDLLADRIGHVHISDNQGDRDAHLPVGGGTVPFEAVIDALKAIGYDDTITLEIFTGEARDLVRSRQGIVDLWASC